MKTILDRKVRMYIPSAYSTEISYVTKNLAEKFGGTTNYKTEGTWVNDEGDLIKESITVIEAWYKKKGYVVLAHMIDLALHVKEKCKQDCVAMVFEEEMYIV